jgi:hypothetical protein
MTGGSRIIKNVKVITNIVDDEERQYKRRCISCFGPKENNRRRNLNILAWGIERIKWR